MREPDPPAGFSPLAPQKVRILTPVFDYKIEGAANFSHSGQYKGADFEVVLRPYAGPSGLEDIIRDAHINIRDSIRQGCQRLAAGAPGGQTMSSRILRRRWT